MTTVDTIQQSLNCVDGWLFFDHHHRDPIAYRILGLSESSTVTRRWFYWIPTTGSPVKLVHRIEAGMLVDLPGETREYSTWRELHQELQRLVDGASSVAMQYSPNGALPALSNVDAGTVDLLRSFGVDIVSSAALVQEFEACWSAEQYASHLEAGCRVDAVRAEAFDRIGKAIRDGSDLSEYDIAEFIRTRFRDHGLVTDHGPIVAVNAHTGDPHYEPSSETSLPIRAGDFVLIDLWAKLEAPGSVYYDITWTGYCGAEPPEDVARVFAIVTGARDRALAYVQDAVASGRSICGRQVDEVARDYIVSQGYGERFVHRLGHSIGEDVHGYGANLDNFETRDERPIIPATCFSIEPGIYLPEFGVRSEIDCYVSEKEAVATGEVQREIVRIT